MKKIVLLLLAVLSMANGRANSDCSNCIPLTSKQIYDIGVLLNSKPIGLSHSKALAVIGGKDSSVVIEGPAYKVEDQLFPPRFHFESELSAVSLYESVNELLWESRPAGKQMGVQQTNTELWMFYLGMAIIGVIEYLLVRSFIIFDQKSMRSLWRIGIALSVVTSIIVVAIYQSDYVGNTVESFFTHAIVFNCIFMITFLMSLLVEGLKRTEWKKIMKT